MILDQYNTKIKPNINPKHLTKTGRISNKKPCKLRNNNHWHRCYDPSCLTFWQHGFLGMANGSGKHNITGHMCPNCKRQNYRIWRSSKDNLIRV